MNARMVPTKFRTRAAEHHGYGEPNRQTRMLEEIFDSPAGTAIFHARLVAIMNKLEREHFGIEFGLFLHCELYLTHPKILRPRKPVICALSCGLLLPDLRSWRGNCRKWRPRMACSTQSHTCAGLLRERSHSAPCRAMLMRGMLGRPALRQKTPRSAATARRLKR